ncbi:SPOR domain-containing protein [Pseudoalteromonas sp. SWN166]|uniref:SPOR domain-containing protein n=1 Tax=Pseudoalteromonas sp. SWN166 TaxID=2792061 RepID=UPI0018CEC14C|nr:SPOR domain-containing protein [Pseudoalteromonas sp. SWN166]MBH0038063.1 SPOR domain-containing protein [Pseudoalteromonas sp. SWN166]
MFIYKKNNIGLLLSLLMLLFGTACSVTPEKKAIDEQSQSNSPDYVSITALELAQLKDAAMQWQQAREGIERILRLEKEITYLVNHIDIINSKAIAQSNQGYSSKSVRSPRNTRNVKSRQQVKQNDSNKKQTVKLNTPKHVFALQVASVDSEQGVAKAWQELNTKAAPLFRDKILTNVETAKINDKMFYRLKLGSYQNFKNAKADCAVFKLYKLDCIVSNYTDKPIKL